MKKLMIVPFACLMLQGCVVESVEDRHGDARWHSEDHDHDPHDDNRHDRDHDDRRY
jgi:hypothetical protein